jgi:vitamin B12 transporter
VTILDEETIKSMQVPTVLEVLRQVEGLDVVRSGGPGGQTSFFLRGGNSNHVLVLIDGIKVNSPTTGAFDPSHLTVDEIERVEILRGSQSPLYGSEAVAGVINIITKRGRDDGRDAVTFEGGSYETWRGTLAHSGRGPTWDRNLSISRWTTQGFSKASEARGNIEDDGYQNTTFSARLGRGFGLGGRVNLNLRLTDATTDIDDFSSSAPYLPTDGSSTSRNKVAVAGLSLSAPITPLWDHRLVIGWSRDHGTTDGASSSDLDAQSRQLEWQHSLAVGPDNLLAVGYEYQSRLAAISTGGDHRIVTNALYFHDQLAVFDPLFFSFGGRSDGSNRFGRHNTYKVGSSVVLESWRTRLFGNYGTGFRGPTLNDLFFPGSSNPLLRPERSQGYEVGLSHDLVPKTLKLGATFFRTAYKDLIVFPFVPPFLPINVNTAKARGVEVSSEWTTGPTATIQANYTYTGTRDDSTGDQLVRRPRNKANLALIFHPDHEADLRIDYRYVGERLDFGGETIPSYSVVNVAAAQQWTPAVKLFARIENFFDREYEEVTGFGTAGRSFNGGLTITF